MEIVIATHSRFVYLDLLHRCRINGQYTMNEQRLRKMNLDLGLQKLILIRSVMIYQTRVLSRLTLSKCETTS